MCFCGKKSIPKKLQSGDTTYIYISTVIQCLYRYTDIGSDVIVTLLCVGLGNTSTPGKCFEVILLQLQFVRWDHVTALYVCVLFYKCYYGTLYVSPKTGVEYASEQFGFVTECLLLQGLHFGCLKS